MGGDDVRDRVWVHHENVNPSSLAFRDQFTLPREFCTRDTVAVGEDSFAVWQQVIDERLLGLAVGSALRLAGPVEVVAVPVTGLAPSTTTVLERRADTRTAAFAATARGVAESLIDLVREATISPR